MGSGTSDDFDLIGLSSGEDEGACQDVLSHDEFDRRLRECAQQILSQLETGAWRQEEFSKFQLGVGEDMAHQHRSLRVEEDGGSEWPPLEDEVNCGGQESCPAGIAEERVELEGFSFLPLSSEGAVAVTTLKTGGGEDGRCGAQSVMVVPEVIGPVATTTIADIRLVPVEKLAPPSLEGLSKQNLALCGVLNVTFPLPTPSLSPFSSLPSSPSPPSSSSPSSSSPSSLLLPPFPPLPLFPLPLPSSSPPLLRSRSICCELFITG